MEQFFTLLGMNVKLSLCLIKHHAMNMGGVCSSTHF